jgi:hypothetical protein
MVFPPAWPAALRRVATTDGQEGYSRQLSNAIAKSSPENM